MANAVVAHALSFAYRLRPILDDVSFVIEEGKFIGIIGPNGGGKTTLLKLLMGLLQPKKGEVRLFGKTPENARSLIGYVPQGLHYDPSFPISTMELVLLGRLGHLPWWGRFRQHDLELAREALGRVGLADEAERPFASLSGGQRQRALIARALASEPKILLLDEPTANLDVDTEEQVYQLLETLKGECTLLMVTHNLHFAVERVDAILCVEQTASYFGPDEICEHFALGLYHHPLARSSCTLPSGKEKKQ